MPDLAHELHDLVLTMDRQAAVRLAPLGLTYRRFVALVVIEEHPGLRGRDLAGALGVTEAATSGIVGGLLEALLVRDVSSPGSGRARHLELTPAGHTLLDQARADLGGSFESVVRSAGVDPAALSASIRAIHEALVADPPTPSRKRRTTR